ncbi:MAG: hypothetical protein Q9217_003673 [Psora testacea]
MNVALQDHLARTSSQNVAMPSAESINHTSSISAHTAFTNEAPSYARRNHFAQAPSLPPMQQATQYRRSDPTSQGWMAHPPHSPHPPTATVLHSQLPSCEEASRVSEDAPVYVNAKQFNRILKRRDARQRLNEISGSMPRGRKSYMHESRHRHAARRARGPGGKFLSKNQTPGTRNEPKQINEKEKEKEVESIDGILEKHEGRGWKGMIHRGSQDEGSCKLGPSTIDSARSDRQVKTEETREINRRYQHHLMEMKSWKNCINGTQPRTATGHTFLI